MTQSGRQSHLFSPFSIRGVTLRNRAVLAPMQMYSGSDGFPSDWHAHHLAKFAVGGFGTVFTEALAVQEIGRNTYGDLGIWKDDFVPPLRSLADAIRGSGALAAAQLFHAGPKASRQRPWEGYEPLGEVEAARGESPWTPLSPSGDARVEGWDAPKAMTIAEIQEAIEAYGAGARRANEAGFDVLGIHGAHGYLIHSFYSPLGNDRTDAYGGDIKRRMRLALEVAEVVRANWPDHKPLLYRLSCIDGAEGGWSLEDTVRLSRELARRGVDVIDCSSRGIGVSPTGMAVPRVPGFQVPFAARVRRDAGVPTMAVGLIREAQPAEDILGSGRADLVCIAREALFNPHWPLQAALELGADPEYRHWPLPYGWWLHRRAQQLALGEEYRRANTGDGFDTVELPPDAPSPTGKRA